MAAIAFLNHPNWWLAGGAVRNTVWRSQWMLIRWHKLAIAAYQVLGFHQLDSVNSS